MPALIDIRRRIRSVKSTQQITKAMKMVSAAKLRRAQEAMFAARPYARKMMEVLNSHGLPGDARRAPAPRGAGPREGPAGRHHRRQGAVRRLQRQHHPHRHALPRRAPGRRRRARPRGPQGPRLLPPPRGQGPLRATWGSSRPCATRPRGRSPPSSSSAFTRGEVDQVFLVYNEFKSVIQQRLVVDRLLPIERHAHRPRGARRSTTSTSRSRRGSSTPSSPSTSRCRCGGRCSSRPAAEHGARMTAMDAATNNASDMIDRLTLLHEQGPPGRDHQGDHRGRLGRGRALVGEQALMAQANVGRVVQIIGPVVDVEFDEDIPPIYQAAPHHGRRAATAGCRST